jgi:Flp pilus assembly protein TadG
MTSLKTLHRRFAKSQDGTFAIYFAFLLLPFCLLIGLSVDGGRAVMTHSDMSKALDSATLAATRALMTGNPTDADITDLATKFFDRNLTSQGQRLNHGPLHVVIDRVLKVVTITVNGTIPATFSAVIGPDHKFIDMSVESQATYAINDIELGLVLDTTGSMGWASASGKPKIDELKVAAAKMFDILLPDGGAPGDTRIGIAPFAASVNAGPFANAVSHGASKDDCVVERVGTNAFTDADPMPNNEQLEVIATSTFKNNYSCPDGQVLPLTNDKDVLKAQVNGLNPKGSTAGHLGTAWGWYLVSPNWNDVWAGAGVAKPYGTKNLVKSIVLMTDGAYNTRFNGAVSENQAVNVCAAAKTEGIIVYTIGFATTPAEEVTLNTCASIDPDTGKPAFYHAENGADLTAAFSDIAAKLGQLRVSR